jgi:hypothetical protein
VLDEGGNDPGLHQELSTSEIMTAPTADRSDSWRSRELHSSWRDAQRVLEMGFLRFDPRGAVAISLMLMDVDAGLRYAVFPLCTVVLWE